MFDPRDPIYDAPGIGEPPELTQAREAAQRADQAAQEAGHARERAARVFQVARREHLADLEHAREIGAYMRNSTDWSQHRGATPTLEPVYAEPEHEGLVVSTKLWLGGEPMAEVYGQDGGTGERMAQAIAEAGAIILALADEIEVRRRPVPERALRDEALKATAGTTSVVVAAHALSPDEQAFVLAGHRVYAMQAYRVRTGCKLTVAMSVVDAALQCVAAVRRGGDNAE